MNLKNARSCLAPILALFLVVAAPPLPAQDSTPSTIKLQGHLSDQTGGEKVPANGTYEMTFTLYNEFGDLLATDGPRSVLISDGIYEVELNFPPDAFREPDRFIEIAVEDEVLAPRIHVASTPFAYVADTLDGREGDELDQSGEVSTLTTRIDSTDQTLASHLNDEQDPHDQYVLKVGDTMTGDLIVDANVGVGTTLPLVPLHNNGELITRGPWVDVRDFCVSPECDDIHTQFDVALRAAVEFACDVDGNCSMPVYIPAGTYRFPSTITLSDRNGLTLLGAGPYATILEHDPPGDPESCDPISAFELPDCKHATLVGLAIYADECTSAALVVERGNYGEFRHLRVNRRPNTTYDYEIGIRVLSDGDYPFTPGATYHRFELIRIEHATIGIELETDNPFQNESGHDVPLSNSNTFDNVTVAHATVGIRLHLASENGFTNAFVTHTDTGIALEEGAQLNVFTGGYVEQYTTTGIHLRSSQFRTNSNVFVSQSVNSDIEGSQPVKADGAADVSKNTFIGCYGTSRVGITPGNCNHSNYMGNLVRIFSSLAAEEMLVFQPLPLYDDNPRGPKYRILADGKTEWGSGNRNAAPDADLYRSVADQLRTSDQLVCDDGIVTKVVNGSVSDSDFNVPTDGLLAVDSAENQIWFRSGGVWYHVSGTEGFQIPAHEVGSLAEGDLVIGRIDGFMSDGAAHAQFMRLRDALEELGVQFTED